MAERKTFCQTLGITCWEISW